MAAITAALAGSFGVRRDGSPDTAPAIRGKARRLLVLLAAERPHLVPTDRIVEVLWDADPPRRPVENVATLVSRLRAALGSEAVVGGRDGYRLGSAPAVRVDLDEAARLVTESGRRLAEDAPGLAAAAAAAALHILGTAGVLVGEPDTDWVRRARTEGDALLRGARHAVAVAACRTGDPATARAAADAADRLDEAAHRLLMTAHQLAGEPGRALACYERLRADLATDPDPATRELHSRSCASTPPVRRSAGPLRCPSAPSWSGGPRSSPG